MGSDSDAGQRSLCLQSATLLPIAGIYLGIRIHTFIINHDDNDLRRHAAREQPMPTYLVLGNLTQQGYDNIEQGPDRVEWFVDMINELDGGEFKEENFFVMYGHGEYGWAAIIDFPNDRVASEMATTYAESGAGRMNVNRVVARGADGYRDYVSSLPE